MFKKIIQSSLIMLIYFSCSAYSEFYCEVQIPLIDNVYTVFEGNGLRWDDAIFSAQKQCASKHGDLTERCLTSNYKDICSEYEVREICIDGIKYIIYSDAVERKQSITVKLDTTSKAIHCNLEGK